MSVQTLEIWIKICLCQSAFSLFYTLSAYCMFICFATVANIMLNALIDQVDGNNEHLDQWRHCYWLICGFVAKINKCFGTVLLILVASGFIRIINTLFVVINSATNQKDIWNFYFRLWMALREFLYIFVVALASHNLQNQVDCSKLLEIIVFRLSFLIL